jgi:hypothetical protein
MYLIRYFDIGFTAHSAEIPAPTPAAAIQKLIDLHLCTRSEIITYFELES